jgi:type IV secretion system protein VirD4
VKDERKADAPEGTGAIALGALGIVVVAWAVPAGVLLLHGGGRLGAVDAVVSGLRLFAEGHLDDPRAAYPRAAREGMPGPVGWWSTAAAIALVLGGVVAAVATRFEPALARDRLARRPGDLRGARPRMWARGRDLRLGARATGFSVGRIDGRRLRADEQSHVAVIAPTRAGKTTRLVIPWVLEHDGPLVVTSTKRDVLEATAERRSSGGRVFVFDPFGEDTLGWSPLLGCECWSFALRQAQWLADASADGTSEIARYWRGEAAKLLAPLLHAAALDGRSMLDVLTWVDAQSVKEPSLTLIAGEADAAMRQLAAIDKLDGRNKGTTYMSAGSVLAAYRYPEVARSLAGDFAPSDFLRSAADTVYVVAAERHQRLLAPLVVSLLSSIVNEAAESGALSDRRLRVLLDEAANIAPLSELPRMLSQAAGHGIRFATVWQSLAQLDERHGQAAQTVLANSTTQLFLGPVRDERTWRYVESLLRTGADDDRRTTRRLSQLERGRALLLMADRLPAVVELG